MKAFLISAILVTTSLSIQANETPKFKAKNCYEEHLRDAVHINKTRKQRYAKLTNGKSKKLSNILIFVEKFALMSAKSADKKVKIYQEAGMNILCDELISLKKVPPFENFVAIEGPNPKKFPSSKPRKLKRDIRKALKKKGFQGVAEVVRAKLKELDTRPSFNCLMKNDLRTILNAAILAPKHIVESKRLGLKSTKKISIKLIKEMTSVLSFVDFFDRIAFPMQKNGVAIICQDFVGAKE